MSTTDFTELRLALSALLEEAFKTLRHPAVNHVNLTNAIRSIDRASNAIRGLRDLHILDLAPLSDALLECSDDEPEFTVSHHPGCLPSSNA